MDKFIEYLQQFGYLNQQQAEFVRNKATMLELDKDELYWEAGKTVRQIGFITDGIIRVYYYNDKGEAITRYFIDENHLILPGSDIDETFIPSEYLSAVTPCKLVGFSKQDWKTVSETIAGWESIVHKIILQHHNEKVARRSVLVSQDATTRYLEFIEKYPDLANRVPLSFIASYLGITQSSLSRIRKNIR